MRKKIQTDTNYGKIMKLKMGSENNRMWRMTIWTIQEYEKECIRYILKSKNMFFTYKFKKSQSSFVNFH